MSKVTFNGRLNLEQQKKRAKELVRAHRRGDADAAERILRFLPRASRQSLRAVLCGVFNLSEAQHVVAREAGFESFARMRRAVELERLGLDAITDNIVEAALAGRDAEVRALLTEHSVLARGSLAVAMVTADSECALELLGARPSHAVEPSGARQWSPLFYLCSSRFARDDEAAAVERCRIAEKLLSLGAKANEELASERSSSGFVSALQCAARHTASAELVECLLQHGAELEPTGSAAGIALPLTDAVAGGGLVVVERVLARHPPPWQLREALEIAIELDRVDLCLVLLQAGAPSNTAGRWWGQGGSALHSAVLLGRGAPIFNALLAHGADRAVRDRNQGTAYALAVRTGHTEAIAVLSAHGASVSELDDVDRLLTLALAGDAEGARALVMADPALKSRFRYTDHQVLCWAIRQRRFSVVPLLLELGLDPNVPDDHGDTPLHLAAGHTATVELLRSHGASTAARNFRGHMAVSSDGVDGGDGEEERSALFERAVTAVVDGDVAALEDLLELEPDLVHRRSQREHKATLLHYVAANGVERQETPPTAVAIAELLLRRGAEVDALAHTYGGGPGSTTLCLLTSSLPPEQSGLMPELIDVLLRHGAQIDGVNAEGGPLLAAISHSQKEAIAALLARGARVPSLWAAAAVSDESRVSELFDGAGKNEREQALHVAARFDRASVVVWLLEHGVDIGARDEQGMTAAHWASWNPNGNTLAALIERGAALELRNAYGGTVLGMVLHAVRHDDRRLSFAPVVEALCRAGAELNFIHTKTGNDAVDQLLLHYGAHFSS